MFRRLIRNCRGSATVQLVFAIPIFLFILLAMIEFSHVFLIQTSMNNAAREAARRMAVADLTTAQGETLARNLLIWGRGAYIVNTFENADFVGVTIEIPVANVSVIPNLAGHFIESNLSADFVMRKESSL